MLRFWTLFYICGDFMSSSHCLPTKRICRVWYRLRKSQKTEWTFFTVFLRIGIFLLYFFNLWTQHFPLLSRGMCVYMREETEMMFLSDVWVGTKQGEEREFWTCHLWGEIQVHTVWIFSAENMQRFENIMDVFTLNSYHSSAFMWMWQNSL